jgi:hypothetical protein
MLGHAYAVKLASHSVAVAALNLNRPVLALGMLLSAMVLVMLSTFLKSTFPQALFCSLSWRLCAFWMKCTGIQHQAVVG